MLLYLKQLIMDGQQFLFLKAGYNTGHTPFVYFYFKQKALGTVQETFHSFLLS